MLNAYYHLCKKARCKLFRSRLHLRVSAKTLTRCSGGINLILRQKLKTGQLHHPGEVLVCQHQLLRKPRDDSHPIFKLDVRADVSYQRRWFSNPINLVQQLEHFGEKFQDSLQYKRFRLG